MLLRDNLSHVPMLLGYLRVIISFQMERDLDMSECFSSWTLFQQTLSKKFREAVCPC